MPTIPEIEQALTDAANNGDMAAIASIVTSLTLAEKQQIDPGVFGYTLLNIVNYSFTDPALAASTAGTFMAEVGPYTTTFNITNALSSFIFYSNPDGTAAMLDNTDPQVYATIHPIALGIVLQDIAYYASSDPATAAELAGQFVSLVGTNIYPLSVTGALQAFAQFSALDGINAIIDNLDPQIYPDLDPFELGFTLSNISFAGFFDPEGAAATAGNFLAHFSLYTDPYSITLVIQDFAQFENLAGVNAVINNIDPQVYPNLNSFDLGFALFGISFSAFSDPEGATATTANFLSHLSLYTDPQSITYVIQNFAQFGLLDGVNTVIDSIDPQVYPSLNAMDLGFTLLGIAPGIFSDPEGVVETVGHFLSHLSLYTDPLSISFVMRDFAQIGQLDGVNAILDNIDPQVYPALSSPELGEALAAIANVSFTDPSGAVETAAKFLDLLDVYTDPAGISNALSVFGISGTIDGVVAVVQNTDPQIYAALNPFDIGFAMKNVANATFSLDDHDVAEALRVFSEALLPYTPGEFIEQSLQVLADDGNLFAFGAVLDYTTSAQWDGLSASFKAGLSGLGITVGSYLEDSYAGSNGADKYFGLGGDDQINGNNGGDILFGNAGNDAIDGGNGNDVLDGGTGDDLLSGGNGDDTLYGEEGDDVLGGGNNDDLLDGGLGNDVLTGDNGNDALYGGGGNDQLFGGNNDDFLDGGFGNDTLTGDNGNDILLGGAGDDILDGGNNDDFLDGGFGADLLTGGNGIDTFALNDFGSIDTITDFNKDPGGDRLDFRDVISDYDGTGPITDYVQAQTVGGDTVISFDADGAGAGSAVTLAQLNGVTGVDIQSLFDNGQILI